MATGIGDGSARGSEYQLPVAAVRIAATVQIAAAVRIAVVATEPAESGGFSYGLRGIFA
jgi:hypothetical protein